MQHVGELCITSHTWLDNYFQVSKLKSCMKSSSAYNEVKLPGSK